MKSIKPIPFILVFFLIVFNGHAQSSYTDTAGWGGWRLLGFIEEVARERSGEEGIFYNPKMRLSGDILYVCSNSGLFRKNLSRPEQGFERDGFNWIRLVDVVRNDNEYLAVEAIPGEQEKRLLFSTDYGNTWKDVTSSSGITTGNYEDVELMGRFSQNPMNPKTLMVLADGIFRTFDFGRTWHRIGDPAFGYWGFLKYHPMDTSLVFYGGQDGGYGTGILQITMDGWEHLKYPYEYGSPGWDVAFHPSNPDEMLCSVGRRPFWKSTDRGKTWNSYGSGYDAHVKWLFYDEEKPEYLYGVPGYDGKNIDVLISENGGEDWRLYYRQEADSAEIGDILDVVMYKGNFLLYTEKDGIWVWGELPVIPSPSPVSEERAQEAFALRLDANPVRDVLRFETEEIVRRVEIIDLSGHVVKREELFWGVKEVGLQDVPAGLYVACFHTNKACVRKKVSVVR